MVTALDVPRVDFGQFKLAIMKKLSKPSRQKTVTCPLCKKPVRKVALKDHAAHVHGVKRYVLAKNRDLAAYSVTNVGSPWQGGLPSLGKRR